MEEMKGWENLKLSDLAASEMPALALVRMPIYGLGKLFRTPHEDKFPHGQWYMRDMHDRGRWVPMGKGWRPYSDSYLAYKVGKNYVYRMGSQFITWRPDKWVNRG